MSKIDVQFGHWYAGMFDAVDLMLLDRSDVLVYVNTLVMVVWSSCLSHCKCFGIMKLYSVGSVPVHRSASGSWKWSV